MWEVVQMERGGGEEVLLLQTLRNRGRETSRRDESTSVGGVRVRRRGLVVARRPALGAQ